MTSCHSVPSTTSSSCATNRLGTMCSPISRSKTFAPCTLPTVIYAIVLLAVDISPAKPCQALACVPMTLSLTVWQQSHWVQVNFTKLGAVAQQRGYSAAKWEADFALAALQEIPDQFAIIQKLVRRQCRGL